MRRAAQFLTDHPALAMALALALTAGLGLFNYRLSPILSSEFLYLIPIALASWFAGKPSGIVMAIFGATAWTLADTFSHPVPLHTWAPYWNPAAKLILFLAVANLLPVLREKFDRENSAVRIDFLTGAAHKKFFQEVARLELERCRRYKHPLTVVLLDVDQLKFVNERFGHTTGDTLLQAAVKTIQSKIRMLDTLARVGEDEFALLLPETQPEPAQVVTRRIQKHLYELVQKNEWPVTFSFGVATFLVPPSSVDEMLKKADVLLFAAKNSGKNLVKHEVIGPATVPPT